MGMHFIQQRTTEMNVTTARKNAKPIGHADLERLLPRPLSEVRAALDIKELDEVHPNGLPKGGWVYEKWAQVVTA